MMAASRRVRIADVAEQAGLGVGTVSRVLNRSPQVSEKTRQRVLEAIEATRYQPSRLATGPSRGTPASVAILVPFLTRPSVVARLAGVLEALELVRPLREVLPLEMIVRGSTTAACGRRTADRAGPAQPEPAGSRSRLSLARAL